MPQLFIHRCETIESVDIPDHSTSVGIGTYAQDQGLDLGPNASPEQAQTAFDYCFGKIEGLMRNSDVSRIDCDLTLASCRNNGADITAEDVQECLQLAEKYDDYTAEVVR